jgi:putative photosynthetic complex assembly protein
MANFFRNDPFPRKVLIGFAALLGFTLLIVTAARLTGYNASQVPPSPVVLSRDLRFTDGPNGVSLVQDAADGTTVAVLPPGTEGFVRGVLRTVSRERRRANVTEDTPLRLARLADGRLTLTDLGTQRVIELKSFGPTNEAAFAAFLGTRPSSPVQEGQPAQAGQTGETL